MDKPTMKSNYGRGPTTGNAARQGKRAAFKSGKQERSVLADSIAQAFKSRNPTPPYVSAQTDQVVDPVKPRKFK